MSKFISSKGKLRELLHWFAGEPKKIISNHYMARDKDLALAMARSELESIYKQTKDSFDAAIERILQGPQIDENDYAAHVSLYTKLREAQTVINASSNPNEFDRRDIIRKILNARLVHLRTRFWRQAQDYNAARRRAIHWFNSLMKSSNPKSPPVAAL